MVGPKGTLAKHVLAQLLSYVVTLLVQDHFFLIQSYNHFEPLDLGVVFSWTHHQVLVMKAMIHDSIQHFPSFFHLYTNMVIEVDISRLNNVFNLP